MPPLVSNPGWTAGAGRGGHQDRTYGHWHGGGEDVVLRQGL